MWFRLEATVDQPTVGFLVPVNCKSLEQLRRKEILCRPSSTLSSIDILRGSGLVQSAHIQRKIMLEIFLNQNKRISRVD